MSKAREIAEERLARGEISEAEFDQLIYRIERDAQKEEQAPQPAPAPKQVSSGSTGGGDWGWVLIPFALVAISLYIGNQRLDALPDEVRTTCMARTGNQLKCDCFASQIQGDFSAFDLAPVLSLFSSKSDADAEEIAKKAATICGLTFDNR